MADSSKLRAWAAWDQAETRRLEKRTQELLRELGATSLVDALPEAPTRPTLPPWEREDPRPQSQEMTSRTAFMFTGKGGFGEASLGGEFYDVRITNKGMELAHAKSIPIFGAAPDTPLDYNKVYDGREFQFNKRGNFGPGNYGVRVTRTGTPRDMALHARATPIFGPPSQRVVDRRKFYDGREFESDKLGGYGPGGYSVRVTRTGTPRDMTTYARNTPVFGRPIHAARLQRPESAPVLHRKVGRPASAAALPRAARTPGAKNCVSRPASAAVLARASRTPGANSSIPALKIPPRKK